MVHVSIGKLDKGYDLQITILESDGTTKTLTGYTGTFTAWRPGAPGTVIATIVGATSGTAGVYHVILSTAFDSANYYQGSLVMTMGGIQETVENFLIAIPADSASQYCTVTELKDELNITGDEHDYRLQALTQQVRKLIDNYCGRTFVVGSSGVERYFDGSDHLWIDDCTAVQKINLDEEMDGTYSSTMSSTTPDYLLRPYNTNPKNEVVLSSNSNFGSFCSGVTKGVKITGTWGFDTTIPEDIRRAAIIQCCRWFKRADSAYASMIGPTELGVMQTFSGLDPDVKLILSPYVRTQYAR